MSRNKLTINTSFEPKLREAFKLSSSCREVGKLLGFSTQTARRYLKEFNLSYPTGRPSGEEVPGKLTGGLARFIKLNPDIKLPTSIMEVVKITNLTRDQVKSSMYRMKLKHTNRIKSLGDLRNLPGAIKLDSNNIFTFKDIISYSISHSFYNEDITIKALLGDKKSVAFKTTLSKLERYKKIKEH